MVKRAPHQALTARGLLSLIADNVVAVDFLASVAKEERGRTRPTSAAGAVDFLRRVAGLQPIAGDPRVRYLKKGVLKSAPHTPKGARPFPELFVHAISEVWDLHPRLKMRLYVSAVCLILVYGSKA